MEVEQKTYYAPIIQWMHWVIALLVLVMLAVGFFLEDIPGAYKGTAFMLHKSTGITIFFLMLMRFIMLLYYGRPSLPLSVPYWEVVLSRIVQYGFYILLIMMPLSGWIMSVASKHIPTYFGLFQASLPGVPYSEALGDTMFTWHQKIAWILLAFVTLHILGALKHFFIDKDRIVASMMPRKCSKIK